MMNITRCRYQTSYSTISGVASGSPPIITPLVSCSLREAKMEIRMVAGKAGWSRLESGD